MFILNSNKGYVTPDEIIYLKMDKSFSGSGKLLIYKDSFSK